MHLLASVLCAASLASAVPSKLSWPDVSIQVSFAENHRGSAIQPLASLPDKFEIEAISDRVAAPFGAEYLHQYATLSTGQRTTFFLRDRKLMVNAPDLGDDKVLAVGLSIVRIFPPLVALLPPDSERYDLFEWEAVGAVDGMYIEMTRECEYSRFFAEPETTFVIYTEQREDGFANRSTYLAKEKYGELVENGPEAAVNVLPEGSKDYPCSRARGSLS